MEATALLETFDLGLHREVTPLNSVAHPSTFTVRLDQERDVRAPLRLAYLQRTLAAIAPARRPTVERFLTAMRADGLAVGTLARYAEAIRTLETLDKPYEGLTRDDILRWARESQGTLSPKTYSDRAILLKRFLRWVHSGGDPDAPYPECVRWLRPKQPRRLPAKEMPTREEVQRLLEAAGSQRDRAIVSVLAECGCRRGELLSLRIRDLSVDRNILRFKFRGKTGERVVPLVQSKPDVELWLSMHPAKNDRKAPLWCCEGDGHRPLGAAGLDSLILKLVRRAGLSKKLSAHSFRHSAATHMASVLKEPMMRNYFGWTPGSRMPAVYVHLNGTETDEAIRRLHGLQGETEEPRLDPLKPQTCQRCRRPNSPAARFCSQCSAPLDILTALDLQDKAEAADAVVAKFLRWVLQQVPPERVAEFIRKEGLGPDIERLARGNFM
ncbi:MAG: tyrosine-type recombinase/integrase [Halobacteria archaeon]